MKREDGFKTLKEAKSRARELLEKGSELTIKGWTFEEKTELGEIYHSVELIESGKIAFVFPVEESHDLCEPKKKSFSLYVLTLEESDPTNFTFPFRYILKEDLFYPIRAGAVYRKPTKALTPEEALTPEGAETLYSFIPNVKIYEFCTDREIVEKCTEGEVFSDDECDSDGVCTYPVIRIAPLPSLLEEVTGLKVKNGEEYVSALTKHLREKCNEKEFFQALKAAIIDSDKFEPYRLSKEEEKAVRRRYQLSKEALFLRYLLYEFVRTESYKNLQENLEKYSAFDLKEDEIFPSDFKKRTEDYILRRYLSVPFRSEIGIFESLRNIAERIGTTYERLLRVERTEDKGLSI